MSHLALIGVRVPRSKVSKIWASQCLMPQRMNLFRFPFRKNLSRSGTFKNLTKKLIERLKTEKMWRISDNERKRKRRKCNKNWDTCKPKIKCWDNKNFVAIAKSRLAVLCKSVKHRPKSKSNQISKFPQSSHPIKENNVLNFKNHFSIEIIKNRLAIVTEKYG